MITGVKESATLLLFLSKEVFTRPYCRLEVETAFRYKIPIITVYEDDVKHPGRFSFAEAKGFVGVPESFQPIATQIMNDVEAIPYLRRKYLEPAMYQQIEDSYVERKEIQKKLYGLRIAREDTAAGMRCAYRVVVRACAFECVAAYRRGVGMGVGVPRGGGVGVVHLCH